MEYDTLGRVNAVNCLTEKTNSRIQYLITYEQYVHNSVSLEEIRSCLSKYYQEKDKQLNQSYQKIIKQLSPYNQKKLKKDELKWIMEKENACNPRKPLAPTDYSDIECNLEKTQTRTLDLKDQSNYQLFND